MLFLLACAGLQTGSTPTGPDRVYAVSLSSTFETQGAGADGEPLGALAGLEQQEHHLRGRVVMTRSRTYRDDSIGWTVRFDELQEGPTADGPWIESGLEGRSIELRTFDDGQILAVVDAQHVTGDGRRGDVYDLLLPTLSPTVPALGSGDSAYRRSSWPFQVSSKSGTRSTLVAEYTHLGVESRRAELAYGGTLEGEGHDDHLDGELTLGGQVEGTVWMRTTDAVMVRHDAVWERDVVVEYASGARVAQQQRTLVATTLVEAP